MRSHRRSTSLFPYYFAPGQIDKGCASYPKAGTTTAVVGSIARVRRDRTFKCIRGMTPGPGLHRPDREPGPNGETPIAGEPAARSLHLDSGDIWEGAPVFNQFNGEVEMRAMSQLGLSAMALGNHEFDKGAVNLEEQYQQFGGFPILVARYQFLDPTDPTQYNLVSCDHLRPRSSVGGIQDRRHRHGQRCRRSKASIESGNSLGVRPIEGD